MTVTIASFRSDYPEFTDAIKYPDSAITYYINVAALLLNTTRWGSTLDLGTSLFIAHNLVIEAKAQDEAAKGIVPGQSTGPVSSKSVDKVSVSYDTQAGLETDAGHWNLSVYGTRFIRLAKMVGTGPIQIGTGGVPVSGAWPGPLM